MREKCDAELAVSFLNSLIPNKGPGLEGVIARNVSYSSFKPSSRLSGQAQSGASGSRRLEDFRTKYCLKMNCPREKYLLRRKRVSTRQDK